MVASIENFKVASIFPLKQNGVPSLTSFNGLQKKYQMARVLIKLKYKFSIFLNAIKWCWTRPLVLPHSGETRGSFKIETPIFICRLDFSRRSFIYLTCWIRYFIPQLNKILLPQLDKILPSAVGQDSSLRSWTRYFLS